MSQIHVTFDTTGELAKDVLFTYSQQHLIGKRTMNEPQTTVWEHEPTKPSDLLILFVPILLVIIVTGTEFLYVLATLD